MSIEPPVWGERELLVPDRAEGMRLDRFLAARFADRSRSWLQKGIRKGQVVDRNGRPMRASTVLYGGEMLRLTLPGIAPSAPPPPLPTRLYEEADLVVFDKPPGLMAHPSGTAFVWALIGLAKSHWPERRVDLVHRLDRDTSGVLLATKDLDTNRFLKGAFIQGCATKDYVAICHGVADFDETVVDAPIGSADGPIRIQMAVRPDGLPARTDVEVLARCLESNRTLVRCRLHTGRTHQIRVHMASLGLPLVGDRLYGVPPEVFLAFLEHGPTPELIARVGARRHALHAARLRFPTPDGRVLEVRAPVPADMASLWTGPLPREEERGPHLFRPLPDAE